MAIFNQAALQVIKKRMFTDQYVTFGYYVNNGPPPNVFTGYATFHSGAQPTANDVKNNWTSYNFSNSNFLGATYVYFTATSTASFAMYAVSTGVANQSGTATWAAVWSRRATTTGTTLLTFSTGSYTSVTPPTNYFFVVPVSDLTTTTGVIRLSDQNLVTGQTFTVSDISLKLGF